MKTLKNIITNKKGRISNEVTLVLTAKAKVTDDKRKNLKLIFCFFRDSNIKNIVNIIKKFWKTSGSKVRLWCIHKPWNSMMVANETPTNLLKSMFPTKNEITMVREPNIGEKNLAATSSDWVGILTPRISKPL